MNFRDVLRARLEQDLGFEIYSSNDSPAAVFRIYAKESGVLAGMIFIPTILELVEHEFFLTPFGIKTSPKITGRVQEGAVFKKGDVLAEIEGNGEYLLKAERTICNIISELSGIATHTRREVERIKETGASVFLLDTRKGDSLMRPAHKYAIRIGGGFAHRSGMFDGILIKDNDIALYGNIRTAIDVRMREKKFLTRVEIEVQNLSQLKIVLEDGRVDSILLDNMPPSILKEAMEEILASGKMYAVEASGVKSEQFKEISATGVGYISTSSLVGRALPIDVSMKFVRHM